MRRNAENHAIPVAAKTSKVPDATGVTILGYSAVVLSVLCGYRFSHNEFSDTWPREDRLPGGGSGAPAPAPNPDRRQQGKSGWLGANSRETAQSGRRD